jgi:hypothetical protein
MNGGKTLSITVSLLTALTIVCWAPSAWSGGPVCPRPTCCPPPMAMCPPPCPPPMCLPAPVCGPQPMCGPPPCGPMAACPPPMCGPRPCPPRGCGDNPLAMIVKGAVSIVAGAVALPFKIVDCLLSPLCKPCYPKRACCPPPMAMCPPPACMPPACGPSFCPPGMAYGMGMGAVAPVGFGSGAPRRFKSKPIAENKVLPLQLLAGPSDDIFGTYW